MTEVTELMHRDELDDLFERRYRVEDAAWLDVPTDGESALCFSHDSLQPTADLDGGLLLRVTRPDGLMWLGLFASGDWAPGYKTVCTTPDPDWFCVVSDGAAWLVNASDPTARTHTDISGVRTITALTEHGLLLLGSLWHLEAYGAGGERVWRSETLVGDNLAMRTIEGSVLTVEGIDDVGQAQSVRLDIRTGERAQD